MFVISLDGFTKSRSFLFFFVLSFVVGEKLIMVYMVILPRSG